MIAKLRELVLGAPAPLDFPRQHHCRTGDERDQRQHDPADPQRLPAPDGEDVSPGFADDNDERMAAVAPNEETLDLIDRARCF